jgi:hypothetical protein
VTKSDQIPTLPPPLPIQGVVGHAIDRRITVGAETEGAARNVQGGGNSVNLFPLCGRRTYTSTVDLPKDPEHYFDPPFSLRVKVCMQ